METTIINAVFVLGGMGFVFAGGLAVAGRIFGVKEDPRKIKIIEVLPGSNCGACGFAGGCAGYAEMLVKGAADINHCTVGRQDVIDKLAGILGKEAVKHVPEVALVKCTGGEGNCGNKFNYQGVNTCRAALLVAGGFKACDYGCLAYGDCAAVCPFGAIEVSSGKPPRVMPEKCTGCAICVTACPKNVIQMVPVESDVHVLCSSPDKGKDVRAACKTGCFACNICVKVCPEKAITIENNLAVIDYKKCNNCGICVQKCPVKSIGKTQAEAVCLH